MMRRVDPQMSWPAVAVVLLAAGVLFCPVQAAEQSRLSPGWQQLHLSNLPAPARIPNGYSYRFDPRVEPFEVYVPRRVRPGKPCGVFAWISPLEQLHGIRRFEPLYEEFNLIAITAANSGNARPTDRRLGLAVCAVLGLSKDQPIDRRRCVISGFSGGARVAAMGGFLHPEIWAGAISWCGGRFHRNFPVSAGSKHPGLGINTPANPNLVTPEMLREVKARTKFVLLTGPKDFNQDESVDIYLALTNEKFQAKIIQEPGLGHEVGSVETMRRALEFVLGPPPP
jgi:predicted esterase